MCNMAAYAGTEPAAPKLFRMLQSQEGLGGGHYNGIATIHNGKIYMIKVQFKIKMKLAYLNK